MGKSKNSRKNRRIWAILAAPVVANSGKEYIENDSRRDGDDDDVDDDVDDVDDDDEEEEEEEEEEKDMLTEKSNNPNLKGGELDHFFHVFGPETVYIYIYTCQMPGNRHQKTD